MVESHANVTQVVFRTRQLGLRTRRLLLHAGDLLGKAALSGCQIDVERRDFLFDGPALPRDLDVQFIELSAQRIPLPEQVADVVDKPVCLDDVIEPLAELAEAVRKLAHGFSSTRRRWSRVR